MTESERTTGAGTAEIDSSHGHPILVAMLPGGPATADEAPAVPEPSHAERARTLAAGATRGTLASGGAGPRGAELAGFPYPAVANVITDEASAPLVFLSTRDPRACDRLAASRVSLMGTMEQLERGTPAFADARERYLAAHPSATSVDDQGFECWRLDVGAVRSIGGFGRMGRVDADGYRAAAPDPLGAVAGGAIEHLNADHACACATARGAMTHGSPSTAMSTTRTRCAAPPWPSPAGPARCSPRMTTRRRERSPPVRSEHGSW